MKPVHKSLVLSRQTLRRLSGAELGAVVGGTAFQLTPKDPTPQLKDPFKPPPETSEEYTRCGASVGGTCDHCGPFLQISKP